MENIFYLTKDQCTVFCKLTTEDDVIIAFKKWLLDGSKLKVEHDDDGGLVIKILDNASEMQLFVLMRKKGGDSVSRTLLGAYNYFRRINTSHESNKQYVLSKVSQCNTSIGIVGKPEFSNEKKHFEYIMSLALCFDGIIFNGSGAVNERGELLLGGDGASTVKIT